MYVAYQEFMLLDPLQYVVAGELRGFGVAIRVTKQDILDEAGLQFIGDAINDLKWVQIKIVPENLKRHSFVYDL